MVEHKPDLRCFLVQCWLELHGDNNGVATRLADRLNVRDYFPNLQWKTYDGNRPPEFGKTYSEILDDHPVPVPFGYLTIDDLLKRSQCKDFDSALNSFIQAIQPNRYTLLKKSKDSKINKKLAAQDEGWESVVTLVNTPDGVNEAKEFLMKQPMVGFDVEWKIHTPGTYEMCDLIQLATHNKAFLIDVVALSTNIVGKSKLNSK